MNDRERAERLLEVYQDMETTAKDNTVPQNHIETAIENMGYTINYGPYLTERE